MLSRNIKKSVMGNTTTLKVVCVFSTCFHHRFAILRTRPSRRKLLCAGIIVLGEFTSLVPTMFPNLESEAAKAKEGGATGVGRILWPLCFVMNGVIRAFLLRFLLYYFSFTALIHDYRLRQLRCQSAVSSSQSSTP